VDVHARHLDPGRGGAEILPTARARIEAQGFVGLDAHTLAQINYWLRLAPAICMVWTAIGTARESAALLWALAPFAALGALPPGHPFDVIYNHGFRHLTRGPRLPRYGMPRRFACMVATVILVGAATSFQLGHRAAGHGFGWFLVAAAFINVSTGFCVPSFIYRLIFGRPSSCDAPVDPR
jgi:hypothetical protein